MATHNWIITTGVATWAAASFDTAVLPANGDTVNIAQGNADIQLGLAQSGVTLAALNFIGSFSGTVASSALAPLAIGVSGTILCNCASTRIVLNIGSTTPLIIATGTGSPVDAGLESFRIRGGGAGCKLYVASDTTSVGVATDVAGLTATITEWDQQGGTLDIGAGVTWTNGYQSGGAATVNSSGTLIQQTGDSAVLYTGGTAVIATLSLTNQGTLNNRPAAGTDAFGTINIGPGATADFSTDPRPLTVTNAIVMAKGSTLKTFDPQQLALHAAVLSVKSQLCGIKDVTLDIGGPVLATLTNY